ncbi:MCP four helix bundle domain-containing protein [Taibaiella koreensis]|uniref:MCP four helix bundle domain-containing protein n=1 Tax=Taibaiella koreensis TaxID=1268548 RepID=UPI000E59DAA4|nr:MCP four helix bundle domain-containing protein [Taibaiella koreensis]
MNLFQQLRYKTRIGLLLAALLICLLLNNIINQSNFEHIEKAATSIYEDRLLPSTYIFELREYVYKRRQLTQTADYSEGSNIAMKCSEAITALIDKYEHTVLTPEESIHLRSLKSNITLFINAPKEEQHFGNTLENLNDLLRIQSREGRYLKADMVSKVRGSTFLSYVEVCLLIIIGAITLSLIGFSKNIFSQKMPPDPSLN